MIGNGAASLLGGDVQVNTTYNRGFTPEEISERALNKIISISSDSHPAVRAQAEAFKKNIKAVLIQYMHEAIRSHNVTLANRFNQMGHPELIKLLDE